MYLCTCICTLTSFLIELGRISQIFSTVEIISCYENKRMETHTCVLLVHVQKHIRLEQRLVINI